MFDPVAGTVREIGPDVRELKLGDAIVFSYMPSCGHCQTCATGRAAMCENGAKSNTAGTLLNGARRFKKTSGEALNHHLESILNLYLVHSIMQ